MENQESTLESCGIKCEKNSGCEYIAYEYLCHLEEAKIWMELLLKESLPPITELEENLRNGVYLARIGNIIAPDVVPLSRIYDIFQHRFKSCGLQFKHTDNINYWIKALDAVNFPKVFHPETMDVYERRNMPKVIYCIHALSTHLFKLGKAPSIQNLYGKVEFKKNEIDTTCAELKRYGVKMPSFKQISGILINESDCDQEALHSFILRTNDAISSDSSEELLKCLCDPDAGLVQVRPENINDYMVSFKTATEEKRATIKNRSLKIIYEPDLYDELLTQSEIQGYIRSTNCDCFWRDIQSAMKSKNKMKLKEIFQEVDTLELKDYKSANIDYYVEMLLELDFDKLTTSVKNCSSREILENIFHSGNRLCREQKKDTMSDLTKAVRSQSLNSLIKALKSPPLGLASNISDSNVGLYLKELETRLKLAGDLSYCDVKSTVETVNSRELNYHNGISENNACHDLPVKRISVTYTIESEDDEGRKKTFTVNGNLEKQITSFQACIRGYLVRTEIRKRGKFFEDSEPPVPIVESKREGLSEENGSLKITEAYANHLNDIVKIQSFWRGYMVRNSVKCPSSAENYPKFLLLRRLALMHPTNGHTYSDHLKVQTLRCSVVETIKKNQELASKLDEIDTKIGLLVHNRMSIQNLDIVEKRGQNGTNHKFQPNGIKMFNKDAKTLLDNYRQLFYMLQTDPTYLTRLITQLPSKSTHLMNGCILSLFNYGSSTRDAYLLLRLFRSALVEEVKSKFQKPADAIRGNPLVLRLAVSFSRQFEGYNSLRSILGFLIENVLNEKTYIDTNPVDIFLRWTNSVETETGVQFPRPAAITREVALSYPEVVKQLKHNLKILRMWVKTFLKRITACADKFPYALRFIAKTLWDALKEKFPETSEKDIIKIVGNVVFYQYINCAIIAPDTFYIISLPRDRPLKPEQRKNLASIAKILQFASSKKGFGVESQHLMCMNSFIISCHEEMNFFCKKCCTVEDLEEHFNITKYSEAILIEKPKIYVTLEEISEFHKILYEEREYISPDAFDPIQEVLDALGEPPSVSALVGCTPEEALASRAGKTQVCLELDKFQLPPEDPTEAEKLFVKTKELILGRIYSLNGRTLKEAVEKPEHSDIASNLMQLELSGLVEGSDDYGAIVDSIINDITNEQQYRKNLSKEIRTLTVAQERLDEKRKYFEDQLSYYEQYLNTCLSNLTKPSKNGESRLNNAKVLKYSANNLLERGVLVSLDGVPSSHLKNIKFEISPTELDGVYSVRGRFMGTEVEKINLDVQDLLKHQFEGQSVMELFGKARINVNLLLHLLNKKFHAHV